MCGVEAESYDRHTVREGSGRDTVRSTIDVRLHTSILGPSLRLRDNLERALKWCHTRVPARSSTTYTAQVLGLWSCRAVLITGFRAPSSQQASALPCWQRL